MANEYYERLSEMNPGDLADGLAIEAEFNAIAQAFGKLPTPHTGGQGFDGPVRVGDASNDDEAVNLGQLQAAIGEAVLLDIATYGNLAAAAWGTLPSNTYLLFGTGSQFSNTPYNLVAGSTYYLQVRHVTGGVDVDIYHDQLSLASSDDSNNVDLRRLFVRTGSTFAKANNGGWAGFALKKPALTAMEQLTPAADQITYYTGGAAAAMTALTAFARTLLGEDSATAALVTLGALASSSYKPRADSLNNSGGAISVFTGDCDTMKAGDFRLVDTLQAQHTPPAGTQYCYVETKSIYSTGALLQVAWPYDGNGALLFRNYSQNTSAWSPWRKVFDSRNILGSVSQSGGIPTGAIIESGSNANGTYTKYADGTLRCFSNTLLASGAALNSLTGGVYMASSTPIWTYPHAFSAVPKLLPTQAYSGAGSFGQWPVPINTSLTVGQVQAYSVVSATLAFNVSAVADGKWF